MHYATSCSINEAGFFILSPQETNLLAQFLEKAFEHFTQYHSTSQEDFLDNIHIIADCYRLILLKEGKANIEGDEHLRIFARYVVGDPLLTREKLSCAISKMITLTADQIRLLSSPWFYGHFTSALNNLLSDKVTYLHPQMHLAKTLQHKLLGAKWLGGND
jgi:hypothetical protein